MTEKDFGGLSEKKLKEFDDLCKRVKDNNADEEAKREIDMIISAEEKKDPKTAFDIWERCCKKTDGEKGSYRLGCLYLKGKVVDRDVKKAAYYFHLAVEKGNAAGLRGLSRLYDEGYIHVKVVKDPKDEEKVVEIEEFPDDAPKDDYKNPMKGFECMKRAAEEMNNRTAMIHLACDYYENGFPKVVERDLDEAIKWVKKATEGKEGDPFVERAVLFAERLFKVDKVKSYDLEACLLDNHFGTVVRVVRPHILKNLERNFFEKGGKQRVIAGRIREYLKTVPRCSNCGLYGHIARECEYDEPVCYYCHQSGHTARDCPKLAKK